jgi:hypothetical protein
MSQEKKYVIDDSHLYNYFNIAINIRERVYGGLPKEKDMVEKYVKAKFASEDTTLTEVDLDLKQELESHVTGFRCNEKGVYVASYALKAACKQYASLMKLTVKKRGVKNTVKEAFFVNGKLNGEMTGSRVYFQPLTLEPDGLEDFAGHVKTMQGDRAILKKAEYIEERTLEFQLKVLKLRMSGGKELTDDDVFQMLLFGQECGIGSCRAFEAGKYDLKTFEPLDGTPSN